MSERDTKIEPESGQGYIGNRPERSTETIPGGVSDKDERIAAHSTQSSGTGKREDRAEGRDDEWPGGHREADTPSER